MTEKRFEKQFSHAVFFTLEDKDIYKQEKLIKDCYAYLRNHRGVVFFAAGHRDTEQMRDVNVQDYDVSLIIVFENKQYQEQYQSSKKHLEFIERNKSNWTSVQVFDAYVD